MAIVFTIGATHNMWHGLTYAISNQLHIKLEHGAGNSGMCSYLLGLRHKDGDCIMQHEAVKGMIHDYSESIALDLRTRFGLELVLAMQEDKDILEIVWLAITDPAQIAEALTPICDLADRHGVTLTAQARTVFPIGSSAWMQLLTMFNNKELKEERNARVEAVREAYFSQEFFVLGKSMEDTQCFIRYPHKKRRLS